MAAATKVKMNRKLEILKADQNLFSRLAVIGQTRSLDMHEVLSHSLGPVPWSLVTTYGNLAKTQKSKLAEALEKEVSPLDKDPESVVWVFDAMAVVQALVQNPDTFGELAEHGSRTKTPSHKPLDKNPPEKTYEQKIYFR